MTNRSWRSACLGAVAATALSLAGPLPVALAAHPAAPATGTVLGAGGAQAIPGRYLVALDGQASVAAATRDQVAAQAAAVTDRVGGDVRALYSAAFRGFALNATADEAARIAALPGVRYVQADQTFKAIGTQANPPSWGLDRIDGAKDNSYSYPNEGKGVTAYILDTGLYKEHPNFEGRASSGYDFIDNDADSADCHGHGTHVSGTVGSKDYGVAKQVKLVGVRVLDCQGSGSTSQIVGGLDWVARNGVKPAVANMSLGGSADQALDDGVQGVINAGIPVAVAAGNDSKDACGTSPARLPAAITLGSTDSNDSRSSFSNYGRCLDLFAPGGSIVSTKMGGGTQTMSGTSMATPHTAGAAAIYLAAHPDATPQQVRDALVDNAVSGAVTNAGSGSPNKLLDVTKLGGTPEPGKPVADFTAQCSTSALDCSFDGSASKDPDGSISGYAWDFGDGSTGKDAKTSHTYAKAGTYTVKLTVTDDAGNTGTTSKQVTAGTVQPPAGQAPKASFTASCWYADCTFDASGSTDPDNDIASYAWKFGDGAAATGVKATHRYPAGQRTYTAQLTVTDKGGRTGTASKSITCYDFGQGTAMCFAG
ncbi:S8 family serine peptidase [Streptomyces sp. NPDC001941]|uniref:S8 family serine peptidase n=1 Tax=Streptomyces sp. NPDC001941 TaxID=3154659 RepID=UPI003330D308